MTGRDRKSRHREGPPFLPRGLILPDGLWSSLLEAYGATARAYHDTRHLLAVLDRYAEVSRDVGWEHPREVYLALLFHDAVYLPTASDSEAQSALLAAEWLARFETAAPLVPGAVESLIRLTAKHGELSARDVTGEEALFLDCDLAIIGASPSDYDRYEADVAREYASVPRARYLAGRRAFLERLLQRERRFLSPYFHRRLDAQARANLLRALDALPPRGD